MLAFFACGVLISESCLDLGKVFDHVGFQSRAPETGLFRWNPRH
uniref:Uncharacterized protein n=1 Tax=Manihot esculenta TaxID=3983 RepID=A0A2C9UDC9_MANES